MRPSYLSRNLLNNINPYQLSKNSDGPDIRPFLYTWYLAGYQSIYQTGYPAGPTLSEILFYLYPLCMKHVDQLFKKYAE